MEGKLWQREHFDWILKRGELERARAAPARPFPALFQPLYLVNAAPRNPRGVTARRRVTQGIKSLSAHTTSPTHPLQVLKSRLLGAPRKTILSLAQARVARDATAPPSPRWSPTAIKTPAWPRVTDQRRATKGICNAKRAAVEAGGGRRTHNSLNRLRAGSGLGRGLPETPPRTRCNANIPLGVLSRSTAGSARRRSDELGGCRGGRMGLAERWFMNCKGAGSGRVRARTCCPA